MKRSVRPSTPADAPAIVALLAEVGLQPTTDPQHLHWKYWQPRADSPEPRSYVLTRGGTLIAHGAIIRGTCAWGTEHLPVTHVIDWAARRGEVGAGVALMKYIGQQTGTLLAIGGSVETLRILPHIGFRPAGAASDYMRPLHPTRGLRDASRPVWKLPFRFARSVAWTLAAPSGHGSEWQSRRLEPADLGHIATVVPVPVRGMAVMGRSVERFRYMLTCPIVSMSMHAVERAGRVRGYFLLASAPGEVRIADCWMGSDDQAEWCAMIMCAVEQAKRDPQAADVVVWASDPTLAGPLATCGFHLRGETPIQIRPADVASVPMTPLRVQMLDNDAAFSHCRTTTRRESARGGRSHS